MLRFILPSIIWTIIVISVSLAPSSNLNLNEFEFDGVDKIAHFMMYTFLSLFWATGLKRQNVSDTLREKAFRISVFGGFFLSFILEVLQEFLTDSRHFELKDLFANGMGCLFGIVIFKLFYKGCYK